jgi:hypothetical protein
MYKNNTCDQNKKGPKIKDLIATTWIIQSTTDSLSPEAYPAFQFVIPVPSLAGLFTPRDEVLPWMVAK